MATIAVELENVNDADLTLFLVEEPEAHLHLQLQAAVLSFLDEQAEKSRKLREGHQEPAGESQVIVATHSPNLSAWVESKKLVFFHSFLPPPAEDAPSKANSHNVILQPKVGDETTVADVHGGTDPEATTGVSAGKSTPDMNSLTVSPSTKMQSASFVINPVTGARLPLIRPCTVQKVRLSRIT
jgi:hypothetical protein